MAYREFHNEKYFEGPDMRILSEGLGAMADNIGEMFRWNADRQRQKKLAADQYKFDLGQGKFENDDKIFFQRGINLTERSRNDLRRYGQLSPTIEKDQTVALQDKKQSDWQFQTMTDMTKAIDAKSKEDKYYDPNDDLGGLKQAAYGDNNDVYYGTRGERLDNFSKVMFKSPTSLRGKLYTSDYVALFGKKENAKASENPNMKSSQYMSTPFLLPSGIPGVTIDHAKQYLGSRADGSVARWVEDMVDKDMIAEVAYNRERNPKMKSMSDEQALLYLKAHPEENLENKKTYADRVIERAQNELMEAADINQKVDYQTKVDKSITNGLYSNDNIGHSYTDYVDDVGEESTDPSLFAARDFAGPRNALPGGTLRIAKGAKVGQAIPLDLNPQYMVNMRNGRVIENKGSTNFNLTGYQMAAYDKNGRPKIINKAAIEHMRPSDFAGLAPTLGVALRGYTLNQGNKLGELASRQSQLDDQLAEAIQKNDTDAQEAINDQIAALADLKQKLNLSPTEISDEDLMSAYKQSGINVTSIKQDMLVKPSQSDIDVIDKNLTRGLNITNPKQYSEEMREADALYRKKYNEAAAKGFKNDVEKKTSKGGTVRVMTPDGKAGTIPADQLEKALKAGFKRID